MRRQNITYNNTKGTSWPAYWVFKRLQTSNFLRIGSKHCREDWSMKNWWSDNLLLFIYTIPNNYQLEPGFDSTVSNWYLVGHTCLSLIHVSMQLSHVHLQKEKSHHRIQRQITFRPKPHFSEKISGLTSISWVLVFSKQMAGLALRKCWEPCYGMNFAMAPATQWCSRSYPKASFSLFAWESNKRLKGKPLGQLVS